MTIPTRHTAIKGGESRNQTSTGDSSSIYQSMPITLELLATPESTAEKVTVSTSGVIVTPQP